MCSKTHTYIYILSLNFFVHTAVVWATRVVLIHNVMSFLNQNVCSNMQSVIALPQPVTIVLALVEGKDVAG